MKFLKRFLGAALTVALVGGVLFAVSQRQDIYDWYRLRDYTPPADVAQLADHTTMTTKARRLFYINRPDIANQKEFNAACSQEASIVLGCYIPSKGIFLYNVTDPRLSGVKEVTAAHEMLHAAYERLNTDERTRIDGLTQSAFNDLNNPRIKEIVDKYRQQDSGVVPNELHSILATEVKDLPADLETYYSQYFTNRKAIVAYSEDYEAEFNSRQEKVKTYDEQLSQLKIKIDANKTELNLQYTALTNEKTRLDTLLGSGDVRGYNLAVPGFNKQVNEYNQLVKTADAQINQYNNIVQARNNLAVEVHDLAQAIDSRPQSF